MAPNRTFFRIWHWNANGFERRKALLQQILGTIAEPPEIIMIQETHSEDPPKLPGYRVHAAPPSARVHGKGAAQGVCIFIRKGITFIPLDPPQGSQTALEMCAIEVVVGKKSHRTSLTAVNVYSNPQHGHQRFKTMFQRARQLTPGALCVVGGDFNSAHKELGHPRTTAKGRNLLEEAENADFNLCTDASQPSRIGTSTVRDTTPDLAFIHAPTGTPARW